MTTPKTVEQLSQMDNAEFLDTVRMWPDGKDWNIECFRYCCLRLGMMQGLVVVKTEKNTN